MIYLNAKRIMLFNIDALRRRSLVQVVLLFVGLILSCQSTQHMRPGKDTGLPQMVGVLTKQKIIDELPRWQTAHRQASPDPEMSKKLATVGNGADVGVYLGTWCIDSRREVSRLWKALEIAGKPQFTVRYVGMDRNKHTPSGLPEGLELTHVPTIVVSRNGKEIGRIVESAPRGIETELFGLLSGERTGTISESAKL